MEITPAAVTVRSALTASNRTLEVISGVDYASIALYQGGGDFDAIPISLSDARRLFSTEVLQALGISEEAEG